MDNRAESRRKFLKFLAASPLLGLSPSALAMGEQQLDPDLQYLLDLKNQVISSPEDAINIFDFERVARNTLPPAHYGYIATGVGDERGQIANRAGYQKIDLIGRRLYDGQDLDTSFSLFGNTWSSPIAIAPAGSQAAFHPDAEIAVAEAAKKRNQLMMLSTLASNSIEDVNEARGAPVWYQLYAKTHWPSTVELIRRVENAGCEVIVMTIDMTNIGRKESLMRFERMDNRNCAACHGENNSLSDSHRPMFSELDLDIMNKGDQRKDWTMVQRARDETKLKFLVKGVNSAEDAKTCLRLGVDGIIVSNHGGRAILDERGTIDVLPEIVEVVKGRVPIMIDGGIRRGSDVFKALALGAVAVNIGRPYLWGLGAFGQEGVEQVLELIDQEFKMVMRQMGVSSLDKIDRSSLVI